MQRSGTNLDQEEARLVALDGLPVPRHHKGGQYLPSSTVRLNRTGCRHIDFCRFCRFMCLVRRRLENDVRGLFSCLSLFLHLPEKKATGRWNLNCALRRWVGAQVRVGESHCLQIVNLLLFPEPAKPRFTSRS